MAYDGKILRRAIQALEQDRQDRELKFQEQREDIFRRQPRLKEIDTQLRSTMSYIARDVLRHGTDPTAAVNALQQKNRGLQQERQELLIQMGLPADALKQQPACKLCRDTGYCQDGRICQCLRNYYAREQQRELSQMLDLGNQSFETFSLNWYSNQIPPGQNISARSHMEKRVYPVCLNYARYFGTNPENLFLFGAPGLGKTHLSAAIAREVSAKGFSIVYDTAGQIFSRFEQQKFGRGGEEDESYIDRVLSCDLLILDDLGTEMTTAFVQSVLYQIINTRLLERRSSIISSNLRPDELEQRYTPQIASRILGKYRLLPFIGEDIRKRKAAIKSPL